MSFVHPYYVATRRSIVATIPQLLDAVNCLSAVVAWHIPELLFEPVRRYHSSLYYVDAHRISRLFAFVEVALLGRSVAVHAYV